MPHIELYGCDMSKNIHLINVSIEIDFSEKYIETPKAAAKLLEIKSDFEAVLKKYLPVDEDLTMVCMKCMSHVDMKKHKHGKE
jgi:hypothetical protein